MTREHIDMLATLVNPVFLLVLILAVNAKKSPGSEALRFIGRSLAGLVLAIILAHTNRVLHLWPRYLLFPSGHMSFVASVATSFILIDRRAAFLVVPFSICYGYLIVSLKYHTWVDVIGALILAPLVTWFCHKSLLRAKQSGLIGQKSRLQ